MEVITERLRLRPFVLEDAEKFFCITQDEKIKKYVPYVGGDSIDDIKHDIEFYYMRGDFVHDFYFVIEDKDNHKMLGALIVTKNCDKELDMSLVIAKEQRRQGYMKEAICAFANSLPKRTELLFTIENDNQASLATIESLKKFFCVKKIKLDFQKHMTQSIFVLYT